MKKCNNLVITVRPPAEHTEKKIDFGWTVNRDGTHAQCTSHQPPATVKNKTGALVSGALVTLLMTRASSYDDSCGVSFSAYACSSCTSCVYGHKACEPP